MHGLIRWTPEGEMLRGRMDRVVNEVLRELWGTGSEAVSSRSWSPAVDIHESADALTITAELAGLAPEEVLATDTEEAVFEPSAEAVMSYLLGHYLNIYMYYVLLNAKASEQSARMVSMKNATDSAESLIDALTLEYNKLRQGNITKELLEIAGGQAG